MRNDEIQILMARFVQFLCKSWPEIWPLVKEDEVGSFLDDWYQANWELLVESQAQSMSVGPVYLSIYRNGSDSVANSSRVFSPGEQANHAIYCLPRPGVEVEELISGDKISVEYPGWQMSHFVSCRDGWYFEEPPFDCVKLETGEDRIIRTNDIEFVVASYDGD